MIMADCFKHRPSVGHDVAIEALKEGLNRGAFTPGALYAHVVTDRVWAVMRPYIEALQ